MADPSVQKELRRWFMEHGGVLQKVEVQWISDLEGYGLVAQEQVGKGETVMEVPLDLCLHAGMVGRSCLKDLVAQEPQLHDMEDELLALLLMAERRQAETSFWCSYIRSLPREYDTPLYWSEDELKHLKGTNVGLLTRMMSSRVEEDWSGIHEVLVEKYPDVLGGLKKDDYLWALATVWSRAIGIEDADGRYMRCLAPVLDMCNHSPQAASTLDDLLSLDGDSTDEEGRVLRLRSHAGLCRGSQCHMLYGPYSNAKLLYSYGFTVRDNPMYLGVDYWVRVPPTAKDAEWKAGLLNSHPLTANQTYDFAGTIRPGWVSPALLATVRMIQLEPDEYHLADQVLAGEVASDRNERATLTTLVSCFKSKLGSYSVEDRGGSTASSIEKLERLLDDLATQQQRQQACGGQGSKGVGGGEEERRIAGLRAATRRRLHALRVGLEDRVVFDHAAALVQQKLRALDDDKESIA